MKTSVEVKENKMGTMKIPYLLFNMACPLTISLMVQAMYNIIDSLFVSRLGENALAAISLAVTLQIPFQRELVQRRIDGIAGKGELLSQRSRTGKLAAGQ